MEGELGKGKEGEAFKWHAGLNFLPARILSLPLGEHPNCPTDPELHAGHKSSLVRVVNSPAHPAFLTATSQATHGFAGGRSAGKRREERERERMARLHQGGNGVIH